MPPPHTHPDQVSALLTIGVTPKGIPMGKRTLPPHAFFTCDLALPTSATASAVLVDQNSQFRLVSNFQDSYGSLALLAALFSLDCGDTITLQVSWLAAWLAGGWCFLPLDPQPTSGPTLGL